MFTHHEKLGLWSLGLFSKTRLKSGQISFKSYWWSTLCLSFWSGLLVWEDVLAGNKKRSTESRWQCVWRSALWKKGLTASAKQPLMFPLKRSHPDVRHPQYPASRNPPTWLPFRARTNAHKKTNPGSRRMDSDIYLLPFSCLLHSRQHFYLHQLTPAALFAVMQHRNQKIGVSVSPDKFPKTSPFGTVTVLLQRDNRSLTLQLSKKRAQVWRSFS